MPTRPISELVGSVLQAFSTKLQSIAGLDFTGNGLRAVRVNAAADGFEFVTLNKSAVGLGSADNTADADKPVSTATQTALDGKSATSHNHDAAYSALGHNHSGTYEPAIAAGTGSQFWRGDKTWAVPSGGSDPWTYVRLASDFVTSSATAVDIGMAFTPAASKRYEFEARLRLRTATATVGPRPGIAWPAGFADGGGEMRTPSSASAQVLQFGNPNAAILGPVGGLPNTTQSWPGYIGGEIEMGSSPSGTVKLQLASETAGTNVTCKAGSYLRYREVP